MSKPRIRYLLQRVGTWDWLHYDLPLVTEGPWHVVSTYETLSGTISAAVARSVADDGRRLLETGGTLIHVETPNERIWTGIVDEVTGDGADLRVRAREWQGYLHDLTFMGRIWGVNADPADLARELWAQVQSVPRANLNVVVSGSTPIRVGSASEDEALDAKRERDEAKASLEARTKPRKAKEEEIRRASAPYDKQIAALDRLKWSLVQAYELLVKQKAPENEIVAAKAAVDEKSAQIRALRNAKEAATAPLRFQRDDLAEAEAPYKALVEKAEQKLREAQKKVREDGGAYKVVAADTPDCWRTLQDLANVAPFDFTTKTERTNGPPKLTLQIHYPRAGRPRDDLVFEQGRNIAEMPKVEVPPEYATEVIGLGAGEGETFEGDEIRLQRVAAADDPRLYRNAVLSDPSITNADVLAAATRAELARLRVPLVVPELVVFEHVNTPIGSWAAGDIITVKLHSVPHWGRVVVKHRIRAWQRIGTSKAKLRLEPV